MKKLFLLTWMLVGVNAFANCQIFVPTAEWNFYGYVIRVSDPLQEIFKKKNYQRVYFLDEADSVLSLNVEAKEKSYFHYATAEYQWKTLDQTVRAQKSISKLCMTDLCSIYDFPKPVQKMLNDLEKSLPVCN